LQALILTIHILACIFLITVVLLQAGKEGMGVIFGGGSGTVFGSSGAGGLLTKVTALVAAIFLVTSLSYNLVVKSETAPEAGSVMDTAPAEQPAAPQGVEIEEGAGGDSAAAPAEGEVMIEGEAPAEDEPDQ
jgi:preprotein translocase subunit SecG